MYRMQTTSISTYASMLNAMKVKLPKMPKKHRKLCPADLNALRFVAERCATESASIFPSTRVQWNDFCTNHMGEARSLGVELPSLSQWNIIRNTRSYDICTDLSEAQQWWMNSRNHIKSSVGLKPPNESCVSACRTLFVCIKTVPRLTTILRCIEVFRGLTTGLPVDYRTGAHFCKKCRQHSVPKCFAVSSGKCLHGPCMRALEGTEAARKQRKELKDKISRYHKTKIVRHNCSRCRCYIKCRREELTPRNNLITGKLMVGLCYIHRFVEPSEQRMTMQPTSDGDLLVCRICTELCRHKCQHCKCYFVGGSGLCDKCRQRDMAVRPMEDTKRRGVCTTCAYTKRRTRKSWKQRTKHVYDTKPSMMWKKLNHLVRDAVELQFVQLCEWMHNGVKKKTDAEIASQYRRIADEEGWLEVTNGSLNVHYKNWYQRKTNQSKKK